MGRSARALGLEFGMGAREMNALLKEHGYLDGEPGAYKLTEKGAEFGTEYSHLRGNPNSLTYSAQWETRTWNEDAAAALRADMEAADTAPGPGPTSSGFDAGESDCFTPVDDGEAEPSLAGMAIGVVAVGAFVVVAPHALRLWDRRIRPAAQDARDRLRRRRSNDGMPSQQAEQEECEGRTQPG